MAGLYDNRLRALDASGVPISGAKLTVYIATTVTPASLYSDAALSVPLSNPVVADSAGVFPQIFAAAGGVFDLLLTTSADVLVRSYEDVPSLGPDTSSFALDFITARFTIRAVGNLVRLEAGDPSPDNIGGAMTLGGWNGTQADEITLDAAEIDTTGPVMEMGKRIGDVVNTAVTTFAPGTHVDIALPTTSRACVVELFDLLTNDDGNLQLQISYDGGVTFKSGSSDYNSVVATFAAAASNVTNAAAAAIMDLAVGFASTATALGRAQIEIITPASGMDATVLRGRCDAWTTTGGTRNEQHMFSGAGLGGYGRATHIRVSKSFGTLGGKYMVTALHGYD